MTNPRLEALWAAHVRTPFPAEARGAEIQGIDLVLLDALAAGCISSVIGADAGQGGASAARLRDLAPQVECVIPHLVGVPREYFSQLGEVIAEALRGASREDAS